MSVIGTSLARSTGKCEARSRTARRYQETQSWVRPRTASHTLSRAFQAEVVGVTGEGTHDRSCRICTRRSVSLTLRRNSPGAKIGEGQPA
ncbi:hypothetical protein PUN4_340113 [Paraburkholderia unamae]|nr:hypothetical protein PUN4_340113 [Paraburkholderia unamae]